MKAIGVKKIAMLALLLLGLTGKIFAQGSESGGVITNTNSNAFLHYQGYYALNIYYTAQDSSNNYHFNNYTASSINASNASLAPSASDSYTGFFLTVGTNAANIDASARGYHFVSNVTIFATWLGFGTNSDFQIAATAPSSSDDSATIGTPWFPSISGGSGGTTRYICVPNQTNWQTGSWTPTVPGHYTFYVALQPSPGYTGNDSDVDPSIGVLETNYVEYNLTVTGAATAPSSSNETISVNTPWTPSFVGGTSGTNYFCVPYQTNWQTSSWTPTVPGTYTFYVAVQPPEGYDVGNDTDVDPSIGSLQTNYVPYTLTVN